MLRTKSRFPKRGEIWWVNFVHAVGTESTKIRPAIIFSNDTSNEFLERVQVVPLTSNVAKIYPSETIIILRGKKNKAAADQITTVSKKRLREKIGHVTADELASVEFVLKLQLGLS